MALQNGPWSNKKKIVTRVIVNVTKLLHSPFFLFLQEDILDVMGEDDMGVGVFAESGSEPDVFNFQHILIQKFLAAKEIASKDVVNIIDCYLTLGII